MVLPSARPIASMLLALAMSAPLPAYAQRAPTTEMRDKARSLMDRGDDAMDAKRYAAAVEAYLAADGLMRLPMTGVAVARAQAASGMLVEALDRALAVVATVPAPGESAHYGRARAEAAELVKRLTPRIASVQVVVAGSPTELAVSIDGSTLPRDATAAPRKLNPGKHRILVSAPGFQEASAEITVREGERKSVPITLAPRAGATTDSRLIIDAPPIDAPSAERSTSPLVWVGFGVGGAALVAGAITGGLSLAKTASIEDAGCTADGACPPSQRASIASATTLANISNVTLGIGLAGAALGVVGVVISKPKASSGARVEPVVGLGVIGLRGAF